ncbi:MAG: EAL domain-containing protein [Acidiferrobacterales bacterium]
MKDAKDLEKQIFSEQVNLLFKQYVPAGLTGNIVSVIIAAVLWEQVPTGLLIGWLTILNISLLATHLLVWHYHRRDRNTETRIWYRRYVIAISCVAFSWAILAFFLRFNLPPLYQDVVIIMLVGVATSALVLAVPTLATYYIYLSIPMLFLTSWLVFQPQGALKWLGVLAAMFLFLMVFAGRNLNRNITNTIRFRFENADLASEVSLLNKNLERRVAEKTQALSESEERFDLAMQGANDGLWDWDVKNKTVYFSPRWKAMLGFQDWEISDSPREWRHRLHPDDRRKVFSLIQEHLGNRTKAYESIHRFQHKDGHYLWVLDRGRAVYDKHGNPWRMVGTQVDISEHKQLEEKLKSANIKLKHEIKERQLAQQDLAHLAKHDPLTSLPNRILFYEKLKEAIYRAKLEDDAIAVLLVDLDNFKQVNDTLGHPVGDRMLVDVSNRLNSIVNKNYFLSRFGGDEFFVILQGCSDNFIVDAYAKEIIELMSQPFYLDNQEIRIGCSIGITLFPDDGMEPDQLIRDADIAMYHAKDQGRNMFQYFTEEMDRNITEKVTFRNMLHGALERNEFEVRYQPQVEVKTGRVTGLEALLRWYPENGENVPPEKFVPLLEETGLIAEVGTWVLRQACQQVKSLHKKGLKCINIAVNLSPRQFLQEELADIVESVLKEAKLESKYLEFEITENIFMEDLDLIYVTMLRLKKIGVKITLDDFGTGYSSLGYLKRFPIDGVKIDKEFVRDIINNNDSRELVTAIIAMAKGLNLDTLVAEGVEEESQLNLLRESGCPTYQGYLYSKPLAAKALQQLLLPANRIRSV